MRKVSLSVKTPDGKVQKLADDINNLSPEGRSAAVAVIDVLNTPTNPPDIFLWANQADAHKNELEFDLFLYTKGFTVYQTSYAKDIKAQLKVLFLYDIISQVQTGAATGMAVRAIDNTDSEDDTLEFLPLELAPHAQEVVEQIAYAEPNLEMFNEGDHEFRRVRGIVARFTAPDMEPFYIVKHLPQSQILKSAIACSFTSEGKFSPMSAAAAIKISAGNETLIVDNHVFVFNESKFIKQFGYDARKTTVLANKIAEIEQHFRLTYPEGLSMQYLAESSKTLSDKLLRADPTSIEQDRLVDQADEFGLALMVDANGAIIIMDTRDATMFANLLNDDYVDSDMTGVHYLAIKKKAVQMTEDSQVNMGI